MKIALITPVILTFNEAPNLARTLRELQWAAEVIIIDSFSTDDTKIIASSFSNVQFITRQFDDHTTQWNFGVAHAQTPWVLTLDADYRLSSDFREELESLTDHPKESAYFATICYCINGHALSGTLYPPRAVLFKPEDCVYVQDGHTQTLRIKGTSGQLSNVIFHDDRKAFSHWLASQNRYAKLEACKLTSAVFQDLSLTDKIRKLIFLAPFLTFIYCLVVKGLWRDGWLGVSYTFQRVLAEVILSTHLVEAKLNTMQSESC